MTTDPQDTETELNALGAIYEADGDFETGDMLRAADKELAESRKLLKDIHDDLLDRAQYDEVCGTKVVNLSMSRWNRLCDFLRSKP